MGEDDDQSTDTVEEADPGKRSEVDSPASLAPKFDTTALMRAAMGSATVMPKVGCW